MMMLGEWTSEGFIAQRVLILQCVLDGRGGGGDMNTADCARVKKRVAVWVNK